jgi:hypothetical protein
MLLTASEQSQSSVDELVISFVYNLRDNGGNVVDRIPIPPIKQGVEFRTTMHREPGFDTGLAVMAMQPKDREDLGLRSTVLLCPQSCRWIT